ncbi:MAG: M15 family metallopeptidase [Candidatus Paceibacterota bacterium]
MLNSRKIEDLHPYVADLAKKFVAACADSGIDVIITSTYRDLESQAELYAQGRSKPGLKVTNAKSGQSFHNWRVAFDFVPIVYGKADYKNIHTFELCGKIAEKLGLEWAGRWERFRELAHCQYTGGLTLADFAAGKTINKD